MQINLEDLLVCPLCQADLIIPEKLTDKNVITCFRCKCNYFVEDGIIDLRIGAIRKGEYDLKAFEKGYEKIGYYKDGYEWAEWDKIPRFVEDFRYPKVKGMIVEWLQPKDNQIILDVGCGIGWFIFEIMKSYMEGNLSFIGLDPVRSNIYWLNYRKKEENKTNLIGILGEAESLPFRNDCFDAIITSEAIEHIFDKQTTFSQMYRVLKPGGQLFITTPARSVVEFWKGFFYLPQLVKRLFRPRRLASKEKAAYDEPLTQRQLKRYLKQAGFIIERFQQNALMPHESYFQFFPYALAWSIIKTASFIENHFKPLFSWAGLHYVVKAKK